MNRRTFLDQTLGVGIAVSLAGCIGGDTNDAPDPAPATEASSDLQLSSIGQETGANGSEVSVQGAVTNYGAATDGASATISLLDEDDEVIAQRSVDFGGLGPDETATFQVSFEVNASRVAGRRITFDG